MRNLFRRLTAWLCDTWLYRAPAPRFTATGPVYLGGSVRASLTIEQRAYLLRQVAEIEERLENERYRDAAQHFAGHRYGAAADAICGKATWGER